VRIDGDRIGLTPRDAYEIAREEKDRAREKPPGGFPFELSAIRNQDDALRFARRWGLLACGPGADHFEEDLAEWYRTAEFFGQTLALYLALSSATSSRDPDLQDALRRQVAPHMARIKEKDREAAAILEARGTERQAAAFVAEWLNAGLRAVSMGIFPWGLADIGEPDEMGDPQLFKWSPNFTSLVGYAFFRMGQVIVGSVPIFRCEHCGRIRARGTGKGSGNRSHCDDTCAQAARDRRFRHK
jgi:hypothetical protein